MTYLQPFFPTLLVTALISLVWHARTKSRWSYRWLAISVCGMALFSWPPVAWLASATLEKWYSVQPSPNSEADAIVVLSGNVAKPEPERPWPLVGHNTYVRCCHAAWLYRHWNQVPVVACGGDISSDAMYQVLRNEGVPDNMIWLEGRSTRTYESAAFAAELLRQKGIERVAVVTDAYHMLRAEACFAKQGLDVVPAPASFDTSPLRITATLFLPGPHAIQQNELTLREWIAILWYRATGKI